MKLEQKLGKRLEKQIDNMGFTAHGQGRKARTDAAAAPLLSPIALVALGLLGAEQAMAAMPRQAADATAGFNALDALQAALIRAGKTPEEAQSLIKQALATETETGAQIALARLAALAQAAHQQAVQAGQGADAAHLTALMDAIAAEMVANPTGVNLADAATLEHILVNTALFAPAAVEAALADVQALTPAAQAALDALHDGADQAASFSADAISRWAEANTSAAPATATDAAAGAGAAEAAAGAAALTTTQIALALLGVAAVAASGGGAAAATVASSGGFVIKGPLSGATVFRDMDGDYVQDAGEYSATTSTTGAYTLQGSGGTIVASGGTDTSTNNAFTGMLAAPSSATVVTPITTMLAANPTLTVAEIKTALGLPTDLDVLSFNPFATGADATKALAAEKAAAQLSTLLNTLATVIDNAGGTGVTLAQAFETAAAQVATYVKTNASAAIDFSSNTTLTNIANAVSAAATTDLGVTVQASSMTAAVAQVVTSNATIKAAADLTAVTTALNTAQDAGSATPTVATAIANTSVAEDASGAGGSLPASYTLSHVDRTNLVNLLDGDSATTGTSPTLTFDLTGYSITDSGTSSVDIVVTLAKSVMAGTDLTLTLNDVRMDASGTNGYTLTLPAQTFSGTLMLGSVNLGTYTASNLDSDQFVMVSGSNTTPSLTLKLDSLMTKIANDAGDVLDLTALSPQALGAIAGGIFVGLTEGKTPSQILDVAQSLITLPASLDTVGEVVGFIQSSIDLPELSGLTYQTVLDNVTQQATKDFLNTYATVLNVSTTDTLSVALGKIASSGFASWTVTELANALDAAYATSGSTSNLTAAVRDIAEYVFAEANSLGVTSEQILNKVASAVTDSQTLHDLIASIDTTSLGNADLQSILEQIRDTGTVAYGDLLPLATRTLLNSDATLTIAVNDLKGLTVTKDSAAVTEFEITVPIGSNSTVEQTAQGGGGAALNYQVPANTFTSGITDNTALTYSATLADGSALPAWLTFTAATRTFSGTPANGDVGALTVRVTAMNAAGNTVYDDFVITVTNTNDAPTVTTAIADTSLVEFATLNLDVSGNFSDVDVGDVLTYSLADASGDALPAGISINTSTGVISVTAPEVGTSGDSIALTVTASDGEASVSDTFTLTVTNDTTAPAAPSLALAVDNGSSSSDGLTGNGQINVSGLETGATWQYSTNGGTSWTSGSGTSFTLSVASYAANSIQVRQTDQAGNTSTVGQITSAIQVVTAPAAPTLTFSDVGTSTTDGITSTATVTVGGIESGATWQYSTNSGSNWTTGSGAGFTLATGTYAVGAILVKQTNAAGFASTTNGSNSAAYTIDTTAPTVTIATDGVPNSSGQLTYTFTFSEAVTGFAAGDITITNGTAGTLSGSGTTYTMLVTPTASNSAQNLTVAVAADKATDTAGNNNTAATNSVTSVVMGTSAANTLTGSSSADVLIGLAGNDTLTGGGGADRLYLGDGTDVVKLTAASDSTTTASDVITGFASGDKIDISAILAAATGGAYTAENSVPAGSASSPFSLTNYGITSGVASVDVIYNGTALTTEATADLDFLVSSSVTAISLTNKAADWLFDLNSTTGQAGGVITADTGVTVLAQGARLFTINFTLSAGTSSFVFAVESALVNDVSVDSPVTKLVGTTSTAIAGQYSFVDDNTALTTVGDNEIHISQTSGGVVQIRYDSNSAAGTTTASDIIQLEGITTNAIDLTKTDFIF